MVDLIIKHEIYKEDNIFSILDENVDEMNISNIIISYERGELWQNIFERYDNNWRRISKHKYLTEEFMMKFIDYLDINRIIMHQKLSHSFIEYILTHFDKHDINYNFLTKYQCLSRDIIDNYYEVFLYGSFSVIDNLFFIQKYKVSQKVIDYIFIRYGLHLGYMTRLMMCQNVSEEFITDIIEAEKTFDGELEMVDMYDMKFIKDNFDNLENALDFERIYYHVSVFYEYLDIHLKVFWEVLFKYQELSQEFNDTYRKYSV